MSGLSHFIEKEGVPTTGISLVREHTVGYRPPRFLWVPFELGRPFGAPNAPEFQTKVIRSALGLLESNEGPVLLEDFPEDAPSPGNGHEEEAGGWVCPVNLSPPPEERGELEAAITEEMGRLAPWYDLALSTRGRSTVGASGLDIESATKLLIDFIEGSAKNPCPERSFGETLKFASEDIKAWYMEAATAQPGKSTSQDLNNWFWEETVAGKLFIDVHTTGSTMDDEKIKRFANEYTVPRSQKHRLDE